jgi:hypothetical protein
MSESDLHPSQPIACTLNPIELATHRTELLPGLLSKADTQATIPEGFRWSFSETDGLLHHIVSVIEAERRCCRFLRFCFTLEPDGGPLWLEVTGPEGTQDFLRSLMFSAPASRAAKDWTGTQG